MRPRTSRPTIREVAAAADVSTQTVSRVINNRPDVASETRARVQKIIADLGYNPSALARSLIRRRSYTLGVVTAGLKFIGPSRTLSGITSTAEEHGYSLLLKELPSFDTSDVTFIFDELHAHHVDGIIWAVPEVGENRKWIHPASFDGSFPMVYLAMEPRNDIVVVSIDNYAGGCMAVRHLIEQGYRHIGHVSGPVDWWEAQRRMQAWRDTLAAVGLAAQESHWVEGNWSSASGEQAMGKLLAQYPEMDAVFAGNDQMALGVIQATNRKGLHIPSDLGIVGFDDIAEAPYFSPPLTTVQQDQYAIGKVAVEQIVQIIESGLDSTAPERANSTILSPRLIVRESSVRAEEVG